MKSWRKLKELTGFRDKSEQQLPEDADEISKGMQDVQDMRLRYEGLHAVSSRVAGRAYGFSEAVQEMANFLVNTFGLVDENEIGQVFKEVSRVQAELSKLLHSYAFHVSETLTMPTESLLNELNVIQGQKKQYDQKRHAYESMRLRRSKMRSGKVEEAKEQFDELAMFLGCRLHSLDQGRPRNLMTQATRHHAAQLHLFRQCVSILEEADPYMNQIVRERNLDQNLEYMDAAEHNGGFQEDLRIRKDAEESDQSSSSDQGQNDEPRVAYGAGLGSRSAPISPLRFSETNGINSIQEVHDAKLTTPFSRTKSWIRRKGSRDLGILHLHRPPSQLTAAAQQQQQQQQQHQARAAYSVIEPSASPARKITKSSSTKLSSLSSLKMSSSTSSSNSKLGKPLVPSSGPLVLPQHPPGSSKDPLYKSGPLQQTPKMSPSSSPPRLSPPRVNELHQLPPPPLLCGGSSSPMCVPGSTNKQQQQQQQQQQLLIPFSAPLSSRPQPLPLPPLLRHGSAAQPLQQQQQDHPHQQQDHHHQQQQQQQQLKLLNRVKQPAAGGPWKNEERVSPLPVV